MREVAVFAAGCLAIAAAVAGQAAAADDVGTRIYAERCVACHGVEGRGDGPVAAALDPPPRNFHDSKFWETRTLDEIRAVVRNGRPGTLMQAFGGVLSDAEIDAVARHLMTFRETGDAHATGDHGEASAGGSREDAAGRADRP